MADTYREQGMSVEALERILEVTRKLATPFDLTTMLTLVVDAGRAVMQADRGSVFLYDRKTNELFSTVATGSETFRFPADRGIVGECAQKRVVISVPDCYADPRFNREVDRRTGYRTRCLLTVPLIGYDDTLVGVLQLLNKVDGVFTEEDQRIATALAAQCAVALQRMQMLSELVAKERMERELALARDIQMHFLPKEMPRLPGYDIAGWSRPADETGGDVFDIIVLDEGRVLLLLGDATGHGIGPALSVAQVRSMLHMGARLGADLDSVFTHINDQLVKDLPDNRVVTAFFGILDTGSHSVTYHSGGQAPLLHFHAASGECEWLAASAVPMGYLTGLPLRRPKPIEMAPGDILALITDGIFERENVSLECFDKSRVADLVRENHHQEMSGLVETITIEVEKFGAPAPQSDDMTMLLVRRLPVP